MHRLPSFVHWVFTGVTSALHPTHCISARRLAASGLRAISRIQRVSVFLLLVLFCLAASSVLQQCFHVVLRHICMHVPSYVYPLSPGQPLLFFFPSYLFLFRFSVYSCLFLAYISLCVCAGQLLQHPICVCNGVVAISNHQVVRFEFRYEYNAHYFGIFRSESPHVRAQSSLFMVEQHK